MLKLTTDRHEASRGLFATAELLVEIKRDRPTVRKTSIFMPHFRLICTVTQDHFEFSFQIFNTKCPSP